LSDSARTAPEAAISVIWADQAAAPFEGSCPNCGAIGAKHRLLDVAWVAPKLPKGDRKGVFACPDCEARFYPPLKVPNYHDPDVMDWGWHQFHIQQGAGLLPITDKISRIDRPAGSSCLEIGCGYGFGLDFAIHALGWQARGIDPSPMAQLGGRNLGITIIDGYFPEADPTTRHWDVIAATEVIEHVQRPIDLLHALRARLAPDGILLLTTPDGAAIDPATPLAALVQLLAPGIHMVFQTEASLRRLLAQTGFGAVQMSSDGQTLTAYAATSEAQLACLRDDPAARRVRFRHYLATRARAIDPGSDLGSDFGRDLGLGFNGRDFFEATIDQDFTQAAAARARLWPAIAAQFGIDLEQLTAIPAPWRALKLNALKDAMPLNLGMILYAEASRLRADPATRHHAERMFRLARAAAQTLADALARLSLNDGLAEDIAWRGGAEAAIEAARSGDQAALDDVLHLAPHADRAGVVWRVLIELVNHDAIAPARVLQAREGLTDPDRDGLDAATRHDGWIVLGQLALAPGGDPAQALSVAARLEAADPVAADPVAAGPVAATLRLGAFTRLVNAARLDEAADLVPMIEALLARRHDMMADDAAISLAVLDLCTGNPAQAARRLEGRAIAPERVDQIRLDSLVRLVNDARYAPAAWLVDHYDLVASACARRDALGADARLALGRLYLADRAARQNDFAQRLASLDLPPPALADLLRDGFVRLVNDGDYQAAQALDRATPIAALSTARDDPAHGDARAALSLLAIATGDAAQAPDLIAGFRLSASRQRAIWLGAFTTLVNQQRYAAARALAVQHDVASLADLSDQAGHDARIALAVLDLAGGDPALVPTRLAGLTLDGDHRAGLLGGALVRLVNQGRFAEAQALAQAERLDPAPSDPQFADVRLALARIAREIGDPAQVAPLLAPFLAALDPPSLDHDLLLLGAFVRLVMDGRYTESEAIADMEARLQRAQSHDPRLAHDAQIALAQRDLAVGDPALVPGRIAGLTLDPAMRRSMLLGALTRLVNQARYDAAAALRPMVAPLVADAGRRADRAGADRGGDDAALALAQLDLVQGQPAASLAWIAERSIDPAARRMVVLGAFVALVNQADYPRALALREAEPIADWAMQDDPSAADAALALIALDLAAGDPAQVLHWLAACPHVPDAVRLTAPGEAFVRLNNRGDFAAARRVAAKADLRGVAGLHPSVRALPADLARDVALGLLRLDLAAAGAHGRALEDLPDRLAALTALGCAPPDIQLLAQQGFCRAVAAGAMAQAAPLHAMLGLPAGAFVSAAGEAMQSLYFALGLFHLAQNAPIRAEAAFAAVRRGFTTKLVPGDVAPGLFWEALRGELIALNRSERGAEASALGQAMALRYAGAPADINPEHNTI
jgi:SAM-dependent methyltransferase